MLAYRATLHITLVHKTIPHSQLHSRCAVSVLTHSWFWFWFCGFLDGAGWGFHHVPLCTDVVGLGVKVQVAPCLLLTLPMKPPERNKKNTIKSTTQLYITSTCSISVSPIISSSTITSTISILFTQMSCQVMTIYITH